MHLTRLLLDPLDREAAALLAEPYRLHQVVMTAFQGGRAANGVLHRVEPERPGGLVPLLVQSTTAPRWRQDAGLPWVSEPEVKAVAADLEVGRVLRFRLRANPTKRDAANGKRVDLRGDETQLAWLHRKAAEHGFALLDAQAADRGAVDSRKHGLTLTHRMVDFDGHLRITDPDAFRVTLACGIGPAKAFGCGLLSVAPA